MQVTIDQSDLVFGVARAFGSVSTKSPLPLLSCLLLETEKDALRITGTDLDVTTSVRVPCTAKAGAKAAVSARHFHDVVRKLPKGPLTLAVSNGQCEVRYGDGKGWSRFPVQDPSDFPKIPELKAEVSIELDGETLSRLIGRTAYAASTEETRPQLNGVLLQANKADVSFVATDGHRLSRTVRKGSFGDLGAGIIIPSRGLQAVARSAEDATGAVEIQVAASKNQAAFATRVGEQQVQVITRLLEGPYPNYEQVIPRTNPKQMTCARGDLLEAVDIVASHADNVTRQVRFSLRTGKLGVSSATELGAGEHTLAAAYDGEDMEIGYNATYLLEILRSIPTDDVSFRLNTALSAGVVEPVGALPQAEEEMLCLIMPLRLPDASS